MKCSYLRAEGSSSLCCIAPCWWFWMIAKCFQFLLHWHTVIIFRPREVRLKRHHFIVKKISNKQKISLDSGFSSSWTHIQGLLQLLGSPLEAVRLIQLLLQLIQEGVFLLQVGEELTPARPHFLQGKPGSTLDLIQTFSRGGCDDSASAHRQPFLTNTPTPTFCLQMSSSRRQTTEQSAKFQVKSRNICATAIHNKAYFTFYPTTSAVL